MLDALRQKLSQKVHAVTDAILASEQEQQERMAICTSCENFTTHQFCNICSCYMPAKTKLANQSCPLKKWIEIKK